jgi:hypothetical protein
LCNFQLKVKNPRIEAAALSPGVSRPRTRSSEKVLKNSKEFKGRRNWMF